MITELEPLSQVRPEVRPELRTITEIYREIEVKQRLSDSFLDRLIKDRERRNAVESRAHRRRMEFRHGRS